LKDPHAQEYGRHGQKQRGIDVLGRRNGDPNHFVGVQCRRYVEPLKKTDILKDSRSALAIKAGLKEIIFATTCPSDTKATDAAIEVEKELRAEGYDLTVVLYSWSDLELKICQHPAALAFFFPSAVASTATQPVRLDPESISALVEALALQLPFCFEVRALGGSLVSSAPAGPCDDVCRLNTLPSESDGNAADFLD
jgi:hypothetical protein